jgi:hypothetical protein
MRKIARYCESPGTGERVRMKVNTENDVIIIVGKANSNSKRDILADMPALLLIKEPLLGFEKEGKLRLSALCFNYQTFQNPRTVQHLIHKMQLTILPII